MNKRIRELILEAGFPKFDKMYVVSDGEELEKFAELIVKECANVANSKIDPDEDYLIGDDILEHFGVEHE